MGGGGYDPWDVETDRENDYKTHRCGSLEENVRIHWNAEDLLKLIPVIHERVAELHAKAELEKTREARQAAYDLEIRRQTEALRKKHGL